MAWELRKGEQKGDGRNRGVFKRLGYLLETREAESNTDKLIAACADRRSTGVTALDPSNAARDTSCAAGDCVST